MIECLFRSIRYSADLFMEIIGIVHLPKRNRLPPISDPLLLKSATELTSTIRTGKVSFYFIKALIFLNFGIFNYFETAQK